MKKAVLPMFALGLSFACCSCATTPSCGPARCAAALPAPAATTADKAEAPAADAPRPTATTTLPLGILGETEAVFLPGFDVGFEARLDTGATTSSIDARDVTVFERDGKKRVSFRIVSRVDGPSRDYDLPVVRVANIKRHEADATSRPSVMLTFRIGHLTLDREFTLADREQFDYPVLLGRNVLSGIAAVDTSRSNTL